jgi:hypothetical protein
MVANNPIVDNDRNAHNSFLSQSRCSLIAQEATVKENGLNTANFNTEQYNGLQNAKPPHHQPS